MAARELVCARHPGSPAELECRPCDELLCRACARVLRDGKTFQCQRCDGLLVPFSADPRARVHRRPGRERPLVDRLPLTWTYLGRRSVLLTLAGLAVVVSVGQLVGSGLQLVAAAVTAAVFFRIVETTAYGADDLEPPDFSDVWDDLVRPLGRMLATMVPLWVVWTIFLSGGGWRFASAPALVVLALWFFLWPLLILVAAISRSVVDTFDPRVWARVLTVMRGDYLIGATVFYAVLLIDVFVFTPLAARLVMAMPIPFVVPLVATFVLLLPMAWLARILGEAARPHVDG